MNFSKLTLLRRGLNWLNPRAPKSVIDSIGDLPSSTTKPKDDESLWPRKVTESVSAELNIAKIKPLTNEDYILECDLKNHSKVGFSERQFFQSRNCRVLPPEGDVITENGELLAFLTPHNRNGVYHNGLLKTRYKGTVGLTGKSLNLMKPFASNYYHWIYEALPTVRHAIDLNLQIDHYLVAKRSPFVISTLAILGVKPSAIREVSEQILECDSLYSTSTQTEMLPNPVDAHWISSEFHQPSNSQNRKLYISRKDSDWRGVRNEKEINVLLTEYGFESLTLSKMTVEDQIEAFANATCIISCHGAGLTNLVFCKKGVKVLEIFPTRWTPLCYAAVAQYIGADYYYCNADPLGLSESEIKSNRDHIPLDSSSQGETLTIPMDKLTLFCELL